MKVLLKQREDDKKELADKVLANVKELVGPYLERLQKSRLSTEQLTLLNILESNLNNIISPFISRLSARNLNLHPHRNPGGQPGQGRQNQQGDCRPAVVFPKTPSCFTATTSARKLGMKNKKINLQAHLLPFD